MSTGKKAKRRDPGRERHPSPCSDEERSKLDVSCALDDLLRATRKSEAARLQKEGGNRLFVDPDLSEHSAMATVSTQLSMVKELADWGKQSDAGRSKGGKERAQQRKEDAATAAAAIRAEAMRLLADHAPHGICGILMTRGLGGRDKIMRALRGDPSTAAHWPAREKKSRKLSV